MSITAISSTPIRGRTGSPSAGKRRILPWVSRDLAHWENHRLPDELPLYDYAPDVRVLGDYVYFCASRRGENCDRYRTKDVLSGPYEKIEGTFDYWDPNLFADDDGRVYFYWGCSNETPIWGVELDPETMLPLGQKRELIAAHPKQRGYERVGEDNSRLPKSDEEIEAATQRFLQSQPGVEVPPQYLPMIRGMFSDKPYIEGAWMDKFNGAYYLQYAFGGTQYNTYGDGVYRSDSPLGPFVPAKNNPYSYKPGGFLPGAGHGSTMEDLSGNLWHTATMRISMNHDFERRVGLWPAGLDEDGELFCNQRFGDWPRKMPRAGEKADPWADPEWMLLSYKKKVTASSFDEAKGPENAADENVQTWWRAKSSGRDEWLCMDLGKVCDVRVVQVNFADDAIDIPVPGKIRGTTQARYIEERQTFTRYLLEGSADGNHFTVIEDKREAQTDLSHDLIIREQGEKLRYLRLSSMEVPYDQPPCISGLRVFGMPEGSAPEKPAFSIRRTTPLDLEVEIEKKEKTGATGYQILWGTDPDKLYHSRMCFEEHVRIGALVEGESYVVRVDAFNEGGITEGNCQTTEVL